VNYVLFYARKEGHFAFLYKHNPYIFDLTLVFE